jgi:predicted dehydrogenase
MVQHGQVRMAVVGLGLIAQSVHLPNLRTLRHLFSVTHVCDVSAALSAAVADGLPGDVRASTDWRDVLDDDAVDAVAVLTPGSHGDVALAALEAGKHVFSEKPLAYSVAEARRLGAAATSRGRVLQVGYMKLYDPLLARARAELARIGELRVVRVTVLHPTDECQFEHVALQQFDDARRDLVERGVAYSRTRLRDALGDAPPGAAALYENVLLGSVIHQVALLRGLGLPLPQRFEFVDVDPPVADPDPGRPPRIAAVAALPGGAQLQLGWTWLPDYPEYAEEVAVFGTSGRLALALPGPYLPAHRARLRVQSRCGDERSDATSFAGHTTGFVRELEAFAASITGGLPVVSDAAGAAADIACLQALLRAASSREGLTLQGEAAGAGTAAEPAAGASSTPLPQTARRSG